MKLTLACALLSVAVNALSHQHVSGHEYKLMKRHQRLSARASPRVAPAAAAHIRKRAGPSRMDKRKIIGEGDTDKAPDNIAEGTATKGCAVWHTVQEGEVCLGLIDKSSSGFTLEQFLKLNPSLNDECSNLVNGKAYCVDTVVGTKSASKPTSTAKAPTTTPRVAAVQPSTDDEDLEDCDESDEATGSPDTSADTSGEEEECEDEDEETTDTSNEDSSTSDDSGLDIPLPDLDPTTSTTAEKPARTPESSDNSDRPSSNSGSSNSGGSDESEDDSQDDASSNDSSSSDDSKLNQEGRATWYEQHGNAGHCGIKNSDDKLIVAIPTGQYDNGSHCGKQVRLVNTANGNSVVAEVADSCPGCPPTGIDCSVGLFNALSDDDLGLGILNVKWGYI